MTHASQALHFAARPDDGLKATNHSDCAMADVGAWTDAGKISSKPDIVEGVGIVPTASPGVDSVANPGQQRVRA